MQVTQVVASRQVWQTGRQGEQREAERKYCWKQPVQVLLSVQVEQPVGQLLQVGGEVLF